MAKGKKYRKWYESHKGELLSRESKPQRAIKKEEPKKAEKEPIKHPVHGYFMYECEECGTVYQMYLDKGLEDRAQDKQDPQKHKPVPFMIGCRQCQKGYCKHILWGIGDSEEYEELPERASYFKNDPNEDFGVAVCDESYHNKEQWARAMMAKNFGYTGRIG